ncbi:MAG TPA: hypothetical protein VFZ27_08285 [Terriglobia bacterium]|nr:hypothetical protein [Terriglobia bacterium]
MPFPFEVPFKEVQANIEAYTDAVFSSLQSGFMTMPKGPGFVEYPVFETSYEFLKRASGDFHSLDPSGVLKLVMSKPLVIIVLRAMLGFTPSEWAEATTARTGVNVTQGSARAIDRKVRMAPDSPLSMNGVTVERIAAMITTACELLSRGPAAVEEGFIHRLQKADTASGLASITPLADIGVPYPMVLYERFLGRPFAGHRDSVSELVGDIVESAIEETLHHHGVAYRKTKRAERVQGFEQAPDFIIPDEFNPQVVIEAKLAEDDGTARDKVTRVQHLYTLSMRDRTPKEGPRYEVIACIAGRGFKQRREDMKKLLVATRGKVFTLGNISRLVQCSRLREFQTRNRI